MHRYGGIGREPLRLATVTGKLAKTEGNDQLQDCRAISLDLSARKSWCESNDPDFAAKAAKIVGLYLSPPENAIVICVDEKPSIQALERAQGYLKFPNGRALNGQREGHVGRASWNSAC
jgi:hypothetical protein